MFIEDGRGSGYSTGVDKKNRLLTRSVTTPENQDATDNGLSYNINTDTITLTTSGESAILYLKNNESLNLRVEAIAVGIDLSTGGGAGEMNNIYIVRNPTAGTIVDDAITTTIIENRNFGSNRSFVADVYTGGEGKTFTDGDNYLKLWTQDSSRLFATVDTTIEPGNSIGVTFQPVTGNTSVDIYVALIVHLEEAR